MCYYLAICASHCICTLHLHSASALCICPLHLHSAPALRAQADRGEKATRFWLKQKLRANLAAAQLLEAMHLADPKLCPAYEGAAPMLWELRPPKAGRRGAAAASRAAEAADAAPAAPVAPATPAAGGRVEAHAEGDGEGPGEEVLDRQFARLSVSPMAASSLPRHLLCRGAQRNGGGGGGEGRRREAVASPSIAPGSENRANPRKTRVPRATLRGAGRDAARDQ